MSEANVNVEVNQNEESMIKGLLQKPEFGVFIALILLGIFFSVATNTFLTTTNLLSVLRQTSVLGIVAVGMTLLITSQEFDLSVGSTYALSAVIAGILVRDMGLNVWLAALVALAAAAGIGYINGIITVKMDIPSFITTLGTMMLLRGFTLVLSGGWPISGLPNSNFYTILGGDFHGIPLQALWFIVVSILGYILLQRSKFGYKIFATGGNKEAARLAGINTNKVKIINFVLAAMCAAFASFTAFAYLGSVSPTQGQGMEMEAIAASVVGGTALFGGSGSIIGAFLGAMIMGVVRNGLVLMGTSAYWQQALIGLVIVVAVIINVQIAKNRG